MGNSNTTFIAGEGGRTDRRGSGNSSLDSRKTQNFKILSLSGAIAPQVKT